MSHIKPSIVLVGAVAALIFGAVVITVGLMFVDSLLS